MSAFEHAGIQVVVVVLMVGLGCASDPLASGDQGQAGGSVSRLGGAAASVPCTPESMQFVSGPAGIGYEVAGAKGGVVVRVVDAVPLMPARYENDWTIEVLDRQGQLLTDAQITSTCAFMKLHPHTEPAQQVTPGSTPGRFVLQAVNLSMPGPWDVELTIDAPALAGLTADEFTRCDQRRRALGREKVTLLACVPRDR